MAKLYKEMSEQQRNVFMFLIANVNEDGANLVNWLHEIEEGYESVNDLIYDCYKQLSPVEFMEVVYFVTKHQLKV